jgi:hypothetical protein
VEYSNTSSENAKNNHHIGSSTIPLMGKSSIMGSMNIQRYYYVYQHLHLIRLSSMNWSPLKLQDKYINLDGTLVKFFGIAEDGSYGYYGLPSGSLTRLCIQRVIPSAIIEGERITDSVTKILFYYQENPILNELLPSGHKKALLKLIRKVK